MSPKLEVMTEIRGAWSCFLGRIAELPCECSESSESSVEVLRLLGLQLVHWEVSEGIKSALLRCNSFEFPLRHVSSLLQYAATFAQE